jgi:hypothetical protein
METAMSDFGFGLGVITPEMTPEVKALIASAIQKYKPYRFGMKYFVGEYIYNRLNNILNGSTLLTTGRILTSDVFYDLRQKLEDNGIDVTSTDAIIKKRRRQKIQNEYILEVCRDLGIRRRHAGIITGDAGYLYFRGERYVVSLDELDSLKLMGTDVVIFEKQGTAEKLRYHADDNGVSLLSTRGFLTENALDLSELADINGANNAIVTDDDISGMVIASNAPYPRIGIDFDTLDYFDIRNKIEELEEVYTPNPQHKEHIENNRITKFKSLSNADFKYLQKKRIEIHAVLNMVGEDRFWEWILAKLKIHSPTRDYYNRAIKFPKAYEFRPNNLWRVGELCDNMVAHILEPLRKEQRNKLTNYRGFLSCNNYEARIKNEWRKKIDNETETDLSKLERDMDKLVAKYDDGKYKDYNSDK